MRPADGVCPRRRIRRPPAHWSLVMLCLGALVVLLLVEGLSTRTTGMSATSSGARGAPLVSSRPILIASGESLRSPQPAPGPRVALTFDDGPDPLWTPRIAATLRRLNVPATFFVVGSRVVRYPEVVKDLHRDGFELGNHTFAHAELSAVGDRERDFQITLTETAVAGVAGVRPRLVRPPYSSTPGAVTPRQLRALSVLSRRGYLIALSDFDGEDWRRPGVEAIIKKAEPPSRQGGIVLLHDAGGDRSQTVAALERIVPRLRARGFTFVTVSELAGLPRSTIEVPASLVERMRGQILVTVLRVARTLTDAMTLTLLLVAALALGRAVLLIALARRHVRKVRHGRAGEARSFLPPVTVVMPAYNEAVGIQKAVSSVAGSAYPHFEVIVVDDGSSDGTGRLVEELELPAVRVVRQPNQGKPAALNKGIALAEHSVVVMVDADTVFEANTLAHLVQPLRDPRVGAVSGNTKVGNRHGLLGRWQHLEYVFGFNLDRRLFDVLQCMPTIPGAIGAFQRDALADVGGVSSATLAEDTDITLALGRAGWLVVYAQDARAWTEAPSSLGALWRQRCRWCYGTMQALWKHRAAVRRRGEERIGRRAIPYLVLFQIALPLLAPLIDLFTLYGLVFLDPTRVLSYWIAFALIELTLAVYAFRLDREPLRVLWALALQQFVYRQLMYLVVIESIISALLGARLRWQHIARTGEVEVIDEPALA